MMPYVRNRKVSPILLNDVIFRRTAGQSIFYVQGLVTPDYVVYYDCVPKKFCFLDLFSPTQIISLEQVFEMMDDPQIKTEMLFHLDELRRL